LASALQGNGGRPKSNVEEGLIEGMQLTAAHWVYAGFIVLVVITMAMRRDALIPCIAGTFTLGWIITHTPLGGIETVFKSLVVATRELLSIILVISVIVGLTTALEEMGAGRPMVAPAQKLMKSPGVSFWVLGIVMMAASYFIWPSPAAALLGAILIPAVTLTGLPAISAAVSLSLFGYGVALSTDYVIQGAPSISAKAANLTVGSVMQAQLPLVIVMSVVTLSVAYYISRRDLAALGRRELPPTEVPPATPQPAHSLPLVLAEGPNGSDPRSDQLPHSIKAAAVVEIVEQPPTVSSVARLAAVTVPLSYVAVVVALIVFRIRGTEATTIIGGVTMLLLAVFSLIQYGADGFDVITRRLITGCSFGMKVFTQVIVIASFFYLGSPELAPQIFGEGARGLLFDLAKALSTVLPLNRVSVGVLESAVGCVVGLDGSAFAGLPLTGSLAASLGGVASLKVATVAGLGQIASVWVGAGCVPWGVLAVGASMCGVSPMELARKNLLPIAVGLIVTTLVAIVLM
jgi:hypothetical protein